MDTILNEIKLIGFYKSWKKHCKTPKVFTAIDVIFWLVPIIVIAIIGLALLNNWTSLISSLIPFIFAAIPLSAFISQVKPYLFVLYATAWIMEEKLELKALLKNADRKSKSYIDVKRYAYLAAHPELLKNQKSFTAIQIAISIIANVLSLILIFYTFNNIISSNMIKLLWLLAIAGLLIVIGGSINIILDTTVSPSARKKVIKWCNEQ